MSQRENIYQSGEYLSNNPGWHAEGSAWKAEQITKILHRNAIAPRNICEVGCGAGEILVQLAKIFPDARLVGYETSEQAFALAETRATARISYRKQDAMLDGEHFDLAMAIDVFEHVEDYFGFIRGLKRLGAFKLFHIPLDLSVSSVARPRAIEHARKSVGHIHYFSRETALATLADCGYEIVDSCFTASAVEVPGHSRSMATRAMNIARRSLFAVRPDLSARLFGGYSLLVLAR